MKKMGLFLFLAISPLWASANHPGAVLENEEAMQWLQEEDHYSAYQSLLRALHLDPLNPVLQFNLGFVFFANEEYEKSLKQFNLALQLSKDPELQFESHFNAAMAAGKVSNIDLALQHFQKALELKPDSEEVKTNIELMWQNSEGKGQGDSQEEDKKKDQQGEGDPQQDQNDGEQGQDGKVPQQQEQKPKPFKSKELTQDQVRKILEELKAQEQKIRAQEKGKKGEEVQHGKDW